MCVLLVLPNLPYIIVYTFFSVAAALSIPYRYTVTLTVSAFRRFRLRAGRCGAARSIVDDDV
jgi:hypothetical protein